MPKKIFEVSSTRDFIAGANVALAIMVGAILGATGHPDVTIAICSMVGGVYGTANLIAAYKGRANG